MASYTKKTFEKDTELYLFITERGVGNDADLEMLQALMQQYSSAEAEKSGIYQTASVAIFILDDARDIVKRWKILDKFFNRTAEVERMATVLVAAAENPIIKNAKGQDTIEHGYDPWYNGTDVNGVWTDPTTGEQFDYSNITVIRDLNKEFLNKDKDGMKYDQEKGAQAAMAAMANAPDAFDTMMRLGADGDVAKMTAYVTGPGLNKGSGSVMWNLEAAGKMWPPGSEGWKGETYGGDDGKSGGDGGGANNGGGKRKRRSRKRRSRKRRSRKRKTRRRRKGRRSRKSRRGGKSRRARTHRPRRRRRR